MDKYFISIIVPVYKVENYLSKCINSLIQQTYDNIEIILVDDGSPDKCGIICDEYAQLDKRIVVIHKKNGGLSSARNAGLDIARGDFIMFVDSDDWVELNFCEDALNLAISNNVECVAFGYFEYREGKLFDYKTQNPRIMPAEEAIRHLIKIDEVIYNLAWNKIYSRRLFEKIRFPEGRLFEDQGVTYKVIDLAQELYVSNHQLYHYYRRDDSITGSKNIPRFINDKFDLWVERLPYFKNKYPLLYKEEIEHLAWHSMGGLLSIDWEKEKDLKNKLECFLRYYRKDILSLDIKSKSFLLFYYCNPLFYLYIRFWHKK